MQGEYSYLCGMASECPKISVVVPVYNRAELVVPTLKSIEVQTARGLEIILIDNNSTDGTYEVLSLWSKQNSRPGFEIVVGRCIKPGASAARNAGLALARSEWVMFFDSDDIMPPDHLEKVMSWIASLSDADIIGWDVTLRRGDGVEKLNRFFGHDMQWNSLFHGAMATLRWCARTSLVRDAGGWNESVGYWDDIELGARLLARKPRIHYAGSSGVLVFGHDDSITGTYLDDPERMEPALKSIAAATGRPFWTDIKRAIEYGLSARAGNISANILETALEMRQKGMRRLFVRFAYRHTLGGRRGAAALLKPFCRLCR